VKEVTVRNTELPISDVLEKRERFDVCCEIDGGDQVELEMQADPVEGDSFLRGHTNIKGRAIHNLCDLHSSQKSVGVPYRRLARTYQITFYGYTVFEDHENCFNRFSFRNEEGAELLDAVNILFVELSKLKQLQQKRVDEMTGAEMWAIFLDWANKPEHRTLLMEIIAARKEIKMAYDLLMNISQDADERACYRARRKFQIDLEHNRIDFFKKGMLEGKRQGKPDSKLDYELEIARILLASEISIDFIVKITGLSPDKIQMLGN
jgi:predicted transposase/invertase (TIGR01784 family)